MSGVIFDPLLGQLRTSDGSSSPLTTKGDLYGYSTTNARIPVGTDGYVLTADSTQTTGLKWNAVSGTGTVTSVSVTTANGVSGTVANSTTTPAISLTLGAITPSSVNSVVVSGSATPTLAVTGTSSISGSNTGDQTITLTGDVTGSGTGSFATTLASVVTAGGPIGSATVAPIITYDAKGRLTTVTSATVTPAIGSVTGLGTGIATALAVNVGSAGAPVLFNGAGGTPTSLVGTNITGTASGLTAGNVTTNANLTGVITSVGNATSIASQTGTGSKFVVDTSPTLVTPTLGVATATSINKVTITAPATSATLTLVTGSSLITAGAFALTLTSTAATNATIPSGTNTLYSTKSASITSAQLATSLTNETGSGSAVFATSPTLVTPTLGVASATTINKVTITAPATGSTLTIADGKTLTASNSLVFAGTDGTTQTFQASDTIVGRATTDILTNKTLTAPVINQFGTASGLGAAFSTWSPTLVGFSADPSGAAYRYYQIGKMVTLFISQPNNGTSNSTSFTISLPVTAATITGFMWIVPISQPIDNGVVNATNSGIASITSGGTVMTLLKDAGGSVWTASGGKRIPWMQIIYEAA